MAVDPFFARAAQSPRSTRSGACDLPIHYRDASQFGVLFRVDLDRAREVVGDGAGVEPWPIFGKAIAAIYAWDYRDTSVGSYAELGLGVQCRRKGTSPSLVRLATDMGAQDDQGIWVVTLPVTTQSAFEAGVDLWNYPKYVTPITTRFERDSASVTLANELELSVGALGGPRLAGQPVVTYTRKDGVLLRTRIDVDHRVRWGRGADAKLEIKGDGATARAARALGLDRASVAAAFRADAFRAVLPAGIAIR
ncbi:MAG: acetoacetate decarboxylase family protein [Myxococcales bacterium]|nr:acetoacetate decarboxylase family protein [Myxococcales bacterium]